MRVYIIGDLATPQVCSVHDADTGQRLDFHVSKIEVDSDTTPTAILLGKTGFRRAQLVPAPPVCPEPAIVLTLEKCRNPASSITNIRLSARCYQGSRLVKTWKANGGISDAQQQASTIDVMEYTMQRLGAELGARLVKDMFGGTFESEEKEEECPECGGRGKVLLLNSEVPCRRCSP